MNPVLLCVTALAFVILPGCNDREPVPVHTIVVRTPGNGFIYDGMPMMGDQLRSELVALAEAKRPAAGAPVRAYLKIRAEPGVSYDRVYELVNTCNALGLDKIETSGQ